MYSYFFFFCIDECLTWIGVINLQSICLYVSLWLIFVAYPLLVISFPCIADYGKELYQRVVDIARVELQQLIFLSPFIGVIFHVPKNKGGSARFRNAYTYGTPYKVTRLPSFVCKYTMPWFSNYFFFRER